MKTLKTTATTILFACMGMIILQGCLWGGLGSTGSNSYPSSTVTTNTEVIYHFNQAEYLGRQDYKSARPFYMRSGNISSPLLNSKESHPGGIDLNHFYFYGAMNPDGSDIRAAYSPLKKIIFMAGFSLSSKNAIQKGMVSSVPATTTVTTTEQGYNQNGNYYSTSHTNMYDGKQSLPYQLEHNQSQADKEFAIGYYDFIGNQGIWESFAGFGSGVSENSYQYKFGDEPASGYSSNQFHSSFTENRKSYRLFLQNTIGYSSEVTEASLCARVTYVHFTNQNITNSESIASYEFNQIVFLAEPVMHFGIGFRNFKIFSEYSFAIPLSDSDVEWSKRNLRFGALVKF